MNRLTIQDYRDIEKEFIVRGKLDCSDLATCGFSNARARAREDETSCRYCLIYVYESMTTGENGEDRYATMDEGCHEYAERMQKELMAFVNGKVNEVRIEV